MTTTATPIEQYLTPQDVANVLNVTAQTVINMCRRGELDHLSWGSQKKRIFRIHPDAIEKLRNQQQAPGFTQPQTPDPINNEADKILDSWRKGKK